MLKINKSRHLITDVEYLPSTNCDKRPEGYMIDTIVIHCISLPEGIFGNNNVINLFMNNLNFTDNPSFSNLKDTRVSAHIFIRRTGHIVQFVPFNLRAWHAGESNLRGRENCNDFSIGIELEGMENSSFESAQYESLVVLTRLLMNTYPAITLDRIVGHSDIAPGRKTDPGPYFDWHRFREKLGIV